MIDVRVNTIIYQSEIYYRDLVNYLVVNKKLGKALDSEWEKADLITGYLEALSYRDRLTEEEDILNVNHILNCLIKLCELNIYPVAAPITFQDAPSILYGIPGESITGPRGLRGETGLATDFSASLTVTTNVDSFLVTDAKAARWDYVVIKSTGEQRTGSIIGTWKPDGSALEFNDTSTSDIGGTTDLEFDLSYSGGRINLVAIPATGSWVVTGTRYFIPNNGTGTGPISGSLLDGYIYIGNTLNQAQERLMSGVISMTNTGVTSYIPNTITDLEINSTANITLSKLASLNNNIVVITNGSGKLTSSTLSPTTLGYVDISSSLTGLLSLKLTDPLTTNGDLIARIGGVSTRLAAGTPNQVLTMSGGLPSWQTPASGFADPLTTAGDLLYKNTGVVTTRLPIGTVGQVLTTINTGTGQIGWQAPSQTFVDNTFNITDNGDATKILKFEVSGISTATTRTLTIQNANYTVAGVVPTLGGTGTNIAFTAGSVVFSGNSGIYTEDNANFYWENSQKSLLLGYNTGLFAYPSVLSRIQVAGTTGNGSSISLSRYTADASPPLLAFSKSRGASIGTNTAVSSASGGDTLGLISFDGADGTVSSIIGATIGARVDGTVGTGFVPARLVLSTANSAGTLVERIAITSTGAWGLAGASNYGTSGQILTSNGNNGPTWQNNPALVDPMTTIGDVLIRNGSNVTSRLGIGSPNQVLTVNSGTGIPYWATPASGFADPMTTIGDIMIRNGSNVTSRLGIGSTGQVLTVSGGVPIWGTVGITGLTTNRIPYATSSTTLGDDSGLVWEPTNNILTVGTARLHTVGTDNLFLGVSAGSTSISGSHNIGIGGDVLTLITSASNNVALGGAALYSITTGANNTAIGFSSLVLATGSNNIALGYRAGELTTTGSRNLILGYNSDVPTGTASNQLSIQNAIFGTGNSTGGTGISTGNIGIYVQAPTARLHLAAGSTAASSAPLKFTSGALQTSQEVGAVEFLTDKWYGTITTGTGRKEFTLNDSALLVGGIPFVTTNGRLTTESGLTYDTTLNNLILTSTPVTYYTSFLGGSILFSNFSIPSIGTLFNTSGIQNNTDFDIVAVTGDLTLSASAGKVIKQAEYIENDGDVFRYGYTTKVIEKTGKNLTTGGIFTFAHGLSLGSIRDIISIQVSVIDNTDSAGLIVCDSLNAGGVSYTTTDITFVWDYTTYSASYNSATLLFTIEYRITAV